MRQKAKDVFRSIISVIIVSLMLVVSECFEQKEILFPEMAALTIGYLIVDKHVWRVSRRQLVLLMTLGAMGGTFVSVCSPFPFSINIVLAFLFAAFLLFVSGSTLIPLISASVLPVMIHTTSIFYPISVFVLSLILIISQKQMERIGWRHKVEHISAPLHTKEEAFRWLLIAIGVLIMVFVAFVLNLHYLILPPLIVCFSEMVNSHAGFKNRPLQIGLLMLLGASFGTSLELVHLLYQMPTFLAGIIPFILILSVFKIVGRYFAPAGAIALIPFLLPSEGLSYLPLEVTMGYFLFMLMAFIINRIPFLYKSDSQ